MRVLVVFEDGKTVKSTIMDDPGGKVCIENLKDFKECPEEIKKCIDKEIFEQCEAEKQKKFIYMDENDNIIVI